MPSNKASPTSARNGTNATFLPAHFDISTLPKEILLLIFTHFFEDGARRVSCLSPLSLTCRRWRSVIATGNGFWTSLLLTVPSQRASNLAMLYASKVTTDMHSPPISPSSIRGLKELQILISVPPRTDTSAVYQRCMEHCSQLHQCLRTSIQHTLRKAHVRVDGSSQLHIDILSSFLTDLRSSMSEEAFSSLSLDIQLPSIQGFSMKDNFWLSYSGLRSVNISAKPPYNSQTPYPPKVPIPPKPVPFRPHDLPNFPAKLQADLLPLLARGLEAEAAKVLAHKLFGARGETAGTSSSSSSRAKDVSLLLSSFVTRFAQAEVDPNEQAEYERRMTIYRTAQHKYDSWTRQQSLDWTGLQETSKLSYDNSGQGLFSHAIGGALESLSLEGVWLAESLHLPAKGFPHLTSLVLVHVKAGRSLYRLLESAPNLLDLSLRYMIRDYDDKDITVPSSNYLRQNGGPDNDQDSHMQDRQSQPVPIRIHHSGDAWIVSYRDLPQPIRHKMEEDASARSGSNASKWDEDMEAELDEDWDDDNLSTISEDISLNYPTDLFMPSKVSAALKRDKIYCVETSPLTVAPGSFRHMDLKYSHGVYIQEMGIARFDSLYQWQELVQMRADFYESDAFPFEKEFDYYDDDQATLAKEYADQCARQARARQNAMPAPVMLHRLRSLELTGGHTPIIWASEEELDHANNKYGRYGEPLILTPGIHKAVLRSSLDLNGSIPLSSASQPLREAMPLLDSLWKDRLSGNLRLPRGWSADSLADAMRKGQVIPGVRSDDEACLEGLSDTDYEYYIERPHKIPRRRAEWYQELGWIDSMGDLNREYIEALLNGMGKRAVPSALLALTTMAPGITFLDLSNTTISSSVFIEGIQPLSGLDTLILRGVCELENKALAYLPQYCPRLSILDIVAAQYLTSVGVAQLVPKYREATEGASNLSRVFVDDPEDFDWGSKAGDMVRERTECMAYRYLDFMGLLPDLVAEHWKQARADGKPFSKKDMKAAVP